MTKTTIIRRIFLAACMTLTTLGASAAKSMSVRDVDTRLDTTKIVAPESFEIDTHQLLSNWYLNRYTVLDKNADSRKSVVFEDRDYIDRLQKMPTTIEMPFNPIVRSFIKMYVERRKGLVEGLLGLSMYYFPIFEEALDRNGLPLELCNLAIIESALNPNAVSRAGATGLWQFMASTAQGEGLEINSLVDERRDPYRSSEAAARFLKRLYGMYGDWSLAIAAYNCGPGNVNKALRRAGGGKKDFWEIYRYLPSETRDYIPAFIAANYAMTYYKDHNISPVLAARPIVVDSVHVNRRIHFQQISDVLGIPMEELRALNPQYRTDIIPGDIKPYALILPNLQTLNFIANQDSIANHNADLYVRRETVVPSGAKVTDGTQGGYIDEVVVRYHKVRKHDNLAGIAEKYGVSQQEVIRANNGRKNLERGTTLKINVVQRRYMDPQAQMAAQQNSTDSVPVMANSPATLVGGAVNPAATNVDNTSTQTRPEPQATVPANVRNNTPSTPSARVSSAMNNSNKRNRERQAKAQPLNHSVKSGENLTKIAQKHGVTVDQLRKANKIKGDNLQIGQNLVIPGKSAPASSSRGKGKRGRGRRR